MGIQLQNRLKNLLKKLKYTKKSYIRRPFKKQKNLKVYID